jgi:hypothetical protein
LALLPSDPPHGENTPFSMLRARIRNSAHRFPGSSIPLWLNPGRQYQAMGVSTQCVRGDSRHGATERSLALLIMAGTTVGDPEVTKNKLKKRVYA